MGSASSIHATTRHSDIDAGQLELTILTESVRQRADAARFAVVGMLISIGPFYLVLRERIPGSALAIWILPMFLFLIWRAYLSVRSRNAIRDGDYRRLVSIDSEFRMISLGMQFWVGTGVWSVAGRGGDIDLYVTLAVCIFGFGAAGSMAHDYRSVALSMPLLFGQCIVFWLLKGTAGYHVSVPLTAVMILIIAAARRADKTFQESIAIRFENYALVRDLEAEKESALAAARTAEEANRSKSMFMAAASHDLRQPLYAISLLSDTLSLHDLPKTTKAIVDQQGRALAALRHMFDNLLDLSRFDSGDVPANIEPVFLPAVLSGLQEEFEPLFENRGIALEISSTDEYVLSDFDLLNRLLRNLISNALRYTDEGTVAVVARRDESFIVVTVVDSGRGIDAADHKRVFHEFVQLGNPERSREKGVGLGLSIVQRISRLLEHELTLTSARGQGTRITLRIARSAVQSSPRPPTIPARVDSSPPRCDLYVWIVEDDELVRSALAAHLNTLAVRHDFATSRAELEVLGAREGWPDFVLLDDMLGDSETGLDLAHWLAEDLPRERILLVTGNTEPGRSRLLEQSGFELLRKPVSSEDLSRWLRSAG